MALKVLWDAVSGRRRAGGRPLGDQLAAVPRMAAATLTGRYPGLQRRRLGLMALAALYVISPVDLVPEAAFLLVGLADDALVLSWLAGTVLAEVDAFLEWETSGRDAQASPAGHVVQGEVVR